MKSLELATDLLAMTGASVTEEHESCIVQRTPAEPDFWFGNRVIFRDPPTDAAAAIARFEAEFPSAKHLCIGWDVPNLDPAPIQALFEGTGATVDVGDVLTLTGPLDAPPAPEGITLRAFAEEDWAQSHDISLEIAADDGYALDDHRAYLEGRAATRKSQIGAGFAQRVGAFDGDLLVGDMGVVWNDDLIRYQLVQTRKSHRGRGIASALLGFALGVARNSAPNATPVIVADAESAAGRLYRRCGFTLAETNVNAWRPAK